MTRDAAAESSLRAMLTSVTLSSLDCPLNVGSLLMHSSAMPNCTGLRCSLPAPEVGCPMKPRSGRYSDKGSSAMSDLFFWTYSEGVVRLIVNVKVIKSGSKGCDGSKRMRQTGRLRIAAGCCASDLDRDLDDDCTMMLLCGELRSS
jgi:hypothetical protein